MMRISIIVYQRGVFELERTYVYLFICVKRSDLSIRCCGIWMEGWVVHKTFGVHVKTFRLQISEQTKSPFCFGWKLSIEKIYLPYYNLWDQIKIELSYFCRRSEHEINMSILNYWIMSMNAYELWVYWIIESKPINTSMPLVLIVTGYINIIEESAPNRRGHRIRSSMFRNGINHPI